MRFVGGKHAFAFCTHGGTPDYFFPKMILELKRPGLIVIGARDWYGEYTLYHHCEPYPPRRHPDEIDLKEAEDFGREMVERSWRIAAGETKLITPPPALLPRQLTPKVEDFKAGLKFHKEKCLYPGCRLCMDNCPMDGIDLTVKPPLIAKPRIVCEWCARICPTGAIDLLDWLEALDKRATTPETRAGEPVMKMDVLANLEKAEAEGRFRRLLPKEAVGKIKSYKLHKKHPQWVIGPDSYPD